MSNSTVRYRFEHRLHDWAAQFAQQLTGAPCGFFVGLRDDGSVRRVYLAHPDRPLDGEQKQLLAQRHPSWFLYFPYPEEGRGYLEWLGLPQALAETWLGRPLDPTDFIDVRSTGARDGFPESWRVIVG